MFNPLKNLQDVAALQKQAQAMQQALQKERLTIEENGVVVVITGDQQIESVTIDGVLENRIATAINKAIRETQKLAAATLMKVSQGGGME